MTFATFVGLDLHKRDITACALAADGTLLGEVRRMPVTMEALLDFLTALPNPATIAVEATLAWAWLHERLERLERAGYAVHGVDAYQVKLIWQARSKTDLIDARKLAELLRVNLLPTIWIPDAATRARLPRAPAHPGEEPHPRPSHRREPIVSNHGLVRSGRPRVVGGGAVVTDAQGRSTACSGCMIS